MNAFIFGQAFLNQPFIIQWIMIVCEILLAILLPIQSIIMYSNRLRRKRIANEKLGMANIADNRTQIKLTDDELLKIYNPKYKFWKLFS